MNRRWMLGITLIIGTIFYLPTQADLMKCIIKRSPTVTNFFESSDDKQRKRCLTTPITVVKSAAKSKRRKKTTSAIEKTVKNEAPLPPLAAKDVKPLSTCGGSGGSIHINGKVFHLDPAMICNQYSKNIIKWGHRHVKVNAVDAGFRREIAAYVNKTAYKYDMEPAFIHAIISAESAYNPNATSKAGAMGLMQLMPFTATRFGVSDAYDPKQNIEAGTEYLKKLYDEFNSLELAAAGYNAGENSVRKYGNQIPPYRETQAYVPKVMAYYRQYKKEPGLIAKD